MQDNNHTTSPHQDGEPKVLSVTRNEALFLDDSVTLMIESSQETQHIRPMRPISVLPGGIPAPVELIQKIGKAVLFTTNIQNRNKEYLLFLDEFELLILREVCLSHVKYGAELVGFNLKKKIFEVLLGKDLLLEQEINQVLFDIDQSRIELNKRIKFETPNPNGNKQVDQQSVDEILKKIDDDTSWSS